MSSGRWPFSFPSFALYKITLLFGAIKNRHTLQITGKKLSNLGRYMNRQNGIVRARKSSIIVGLTKLWRTIATRPGI
jgi:hypothetical protein